MKMALLVLIFIHVNIFLKYYRQSKKLEVSISKKSCVLKVLFSLSIKAITQSYESFHQGSSQKAR